MKEKFNTSKISWFERKEHTRGLLRRDKGIGSYMKGCDDECGEADRKTWGPKGKEDPP